MTPATTVPVQARDVLPGEVLAANALVAPRGALVVAVDRSSPYVVVLQVLDSPAWQFERGEVTEVELPYAYDAVVNVVVSEVTQ